MLLSAMGGRRFYINNQRRGKNDAYMKRRTYAQRQSEYEQRKVVRVNYGHVQSAECSEIGGLVKFWICECTHDLWVNDFAVRKQPPAETMQAHDNAKQTHANQRRVQAE